MAFNKNRYYEEMKVELEYFVSLNGAIKLGYIPYYSVETIKYKYFNRCRSQWKKNNRCSCIY